MTQYLLAVHMVEGEVPDPEEMQQAFKDVDEFNAELQAKGVLGVRRRSAPAPSTATVVQRPGRRAS